MTWLKDKWEWVVAGLVAALAFFVGRKGRTAAKKEVKLKEKEIEVTNEAHKIEEEKKKAALEKYTKETQRLREEYKDAKSTLEQETAQRKLELLELAKEDPDEIDKILMEEFNISRLK